MLELERTHGCPMIVRDAVQDLDYLILTVSPESFAMYEAKRVPDGSRTAPLGSPTVLLYGGYPKWVYIGRPEIGSGISPEDQRRVKEEERKRSNARLARELKRDKEVSQAKEPPKFVAKDKATDAKVLPLRPRGDKDK